MGIEAVLIALAPAIAKLIDSATADSYDEEAEYQALLDLQRSLADLRFQKAMSETPSTHKDGG